MRYAALQRRHAPHQAEPPIEVAEAPEPKAPPARIASAAPAPSPARATAQAHVRGGMHLITPAYASENQHLGGTDWAVQVGAFPSREKAAAAASTARGMVAHASTGVAAVQSGHAVLYRARLSGLTHDGAVHACQKLAHHGGACLIVSPASQ